MLKIGRIISPIKKFMFPFDCIVCGKAGDYLCESCFKLLPIRESDLCPYCEKEKTSLGGICQKCARIKSNYLDGALVATYYDHPVIKELIKDVKFNRFKNGAEYLARVLYQKIASYPEFPLKNFVFTSTPIHSKKFDIRGFNQTELVLAELQKLLLKKNINIKINNNLLLKKNFHNAQSKTKTLFERRENIKNTFIVNEKITLPKNIIVLDDVMTTGSTLNEIARTLKKKGADNVWGLVIAREVFIGADGEI